MIVHRHLCLSSRPSRQRRQNGNWDLGGSLALEEQNLPTSNLTLPSSPLFWTGPQTAVLPFNPLPCFKAIAVVLVKKIGFFPPNIISAPPKSHVNVQYPKDTHNITLASHFHFLMNVALTHLQLSKWSNLEALSIKVAYKCKIVHIPGDVSKSYYSHAGEMSNPKKAAGKEQDPAAFTVCELGS